MFDDFFKFRNVDKSAVTQYFLKGFVINVTLFQPLTFLLTIKYAIKTITTKVMNILVNM